MQEYWFSDIKGDVISRDQFGYFNVTSSISNGYMYIQMRHDGGKQTSLSLHRLIKIAHSQGITGMPDYPSYTDLDVDHIDGDQFNNNLSNLQYITEEDHARKTSGYKAFGIVNVDGYNTQNDFIKAIEDKSIKFNAVFRDIEIVDKILKAGPCHLQSCCINNQQLFGYWWTYITDLEYLNCSLTEEKKDIKFIKENGDVKVKIEFPNEGKVLGIFQTLAEANKELGLKPRMLTTMYSHSRRPTCKELKYDCIEKAKYFQCYMYCEKDIYKLGFRKPNPYNLIRIVRVTIYDNREYSITRDEIANLNKQFELDHPTKYNPQ